MKLKDLKRGMKCTYRNGIEFIVSGTNSGEIEYFDRRWDMIKAVLYVNDNLTNKFNKEFDIMKVEDITLNGYKTIWEREEDKYYLRIPNSDKKMRFLNVHRETGLFSIDVEMNTYFYKTTFTLEEIENLPNQAFIQSLIREEI